MKISAGELSEMLGGKLEGDPAVMITGPARIEEAIPGTIAFLANPRYEPEAYQTDASVLLINSNLVLKKKIKPSLIRVPDAYSAFSRVLDIFNNLNDLPNGREEPVHVQSTARIGKDVYLGAFSYIGEDVEIGDRVKIFPHVYLGKNVKVEEGSVLYPGVKVYHDCVIGKKCIIHSGTVIGSDGFGFAPQADGSFRKIPQTGNVVIGDNVEIGANTTIDRATMGSTKIMEGVKIDNLVHIAHNAEIGDHSALAAQVGISGSTQVGKYCQIGGQAGLVGHIQIADRSRINAQSGVARSIEEAGSVLTGSPAFEYNEALRSQVIFRQLPEIEKRLHQLEKIIEKGEEKKAG